MPIRFHLDEHLSASIAAGLRRRHVDVTTTHETGLAGAEDAAQLAFATSAGRVIVTQDVDFLRLHAKGISHAGIVYYPQGSLSIGEVLSGILLIHGLLSNKEMWNRIEFL
jgi:predicted nuclease of predicted toxin-antitoxin system